MSSIDGRNARSINPSLLEPRRLIDDMTVRWRGLEGETFSQELLADTVGDKPHAQVVVDGRVVATVSENGYLTTTRAVALRLQPVLDKAGADKRGPELAEARAQKIAQALGGEIARPSSDPGVARPLAGLAPSIRRIGAEEQARLRDHEVGMFTHANVPEDKTYAEVRVNGEVVATLTNNGFMISSNAMGARLQKILGAEDTTAGPALAQQRAEKIARALGGEIVKAATAQTQSQWNARPPVTWTVDREGLARYDAEKAGRIAEGAGRRATMSPDMLGALLGLAG